VWLIDFDPPRGAEMAKVRRAIVMSDDGIGILPLRIVVPVTGWDPAYAAYPWFVHLMPSKSNGLTKEVGADAFQVKSVSVERFKTQLGILAADEVEEIAAAIALCVGMSI
jgi:mRNA interferase MazF